MHQISITRYDIKAQARPGNITGVVRTEKRFKHVFLISIRNTYAIIFDGNDAIGLIDLCIKFDKGIFARVFDGIGDQVNNTVLQQVLIQFYHTAGSCVLVYNILVLFGHHLHFFSYLLGQLNQVKTAEGWFHFPGLQFFQRKKII